MQIRPQWGTQAKRLEGSYVSSHGDRPHTLFDNTEQEKCTQVYYWFLHRTLEGWVQGESEGTNREREKMTERHLAFRLLEAWESLSLSIYLSLALSLSLFPFSEKMWAEVDKADSMYPMLTEWTCFGKGKGNLCVLTIESGHSES